MRRGHEAGRFFRQRGVGGYGEGLRRSFEAAALRAAEAGFPGAARLFHLTPLEIEWELKAFEAARRTEMERMDDLAWMAGRYAAIGVNAPRKYPRRPDSVRRRPRRMSDEAMKRVFEGLAGGGAEKGGDG